jgi:YVTN family beta-propeller protein
MKLHSRQPRGAKMRLRPGLTAAVAALCIAAGTGRAQYIEDSIDVGHAWVGSLAYNSREDVLYGRCSQASILFAISCDSNKVINSFSLSRPRQMAYDSIDNKAYCPCNGTDVESLAVIDGRIHSLVKKLGMPGSTTAVWDPISDRVYVSCQSTNKVAVVDCSTDSLLKYIAVGACPLKMYLNTAGRKLCVQNYDAGTVSIIDLTSDVVIKTLNVGGNPNAGYYCAGAGKFYSAGDIRECVVISGQSDTIVARIPLPGNAEVISAVGNKTGGLVYLGTSDGGIDDYVVTVSTANDSVQASVVVDGDPSPLACHLGSGLVYCATMRIGRLFVLSSDGSQILDTLQVGSAPSVFAQVPLHERLYLGHSNTRYVYVLKDTLEGVTEQNPLAKPSGSLRVSPNPSVRSVTLTWISTAKSGSCVRVYAGDGRLVRKARQPAGQVRWVWNGRDDSGDLLPPGVYVIEVGLGLRAKVVKLK